MTEHTIKTLEDDDLLDLASKIHGVVLRFVQSSPPKWDAAEGLEPCDRRVGVGVTKRDAALHAIVSGLDWLSPDDRREMALRLSVEVDRDAAAKATGLPRTAFATEAEMTLHWAQDGKKPIL